MSKADLVFVGVIALRREAIGEPHLGLRPINCFGTILPRVGAIT